MTDNPIQPPEIAANEHLHGYAFDDETDRHWWTVDGPEGVRRVFSDDGRTWHDHEENQQ